MRVVVAEVVADIMAENVNLKAALKEMLGNTLKNSIAPESLKPLIVKFLTDYNLKFEEFI